MNKFLAIAGLFLVVALFNLYNVYLTGSGISLILGMAWLAASAMIFLRYRKMTAGKQEEQEEKAE